MAVRMPTASSFYVPLSAHGVSKLHAAANRATKARKHDEALALLQTAVRHSGDGRSYLLLSLHHQRMGSRDGARHPPRHGRHVPLEDRRRTRPRQRILVHHEVVLLLMELHRLLERLD